MVTKGGSVGGRGSMKSSEKRTVTAEGGISSMLSTLTLCGATVLNGMPDLPLQREKRNKL